MTIRLNPYLSFNGYARQAMEFYKEVFGGELTITTFAEFQADENPDEDNLVMHAQLVAPSGMTCWRQTQRIEPTTRRATPLASRLKAMMK
ncbi:hypothetical protein [Arthrobacter sp. FW306-07-I]|uniref:hypothetical protein n=1 Tax=Arthrobacter sp. FW306-07-I TaxID=2879622 RepID=UPI00301A17F1